MGTTTIEFTLTVLNATQVLVEIPDDDTIPTVIDPDSDGEERDYGNADWPSDEEVSARASQALGYAVRARFFDKGDDLCEGIYNVTRV